MPFFKIKSGLERDGGGNGKAKVVSMAKAKQQRQQQQKRSAEEKPPEYDIIITFEQWQSKLIEKYKHCITRSSRTYLIYGLH